MTTERQHVTNHMMRVLMIIALFTAVTMGVVVAEAHSRPWMIFFSVMSVIDGVAVAYYHDKITQRGGRKH